MSKDKEVKKEDSQFMKNCENFAKTIRKGKDKNTDKESVLFLYSEEHEDGTCGRTAIKGEVGNIGMLLFETMMKHRSFAMMIISVVKTYRDARMKDNEPLLKLRDDAIEFGREIIKDLPEDERGSD